MSEIAKWALLLAGLLAIVALVIALPIFDWLGIATGSNVSAAVATVLDSIGGYIQMGKGFCNYLLLPWARPILTGWLLWVIARKFLLLAIYLSKQAYCWLFK